MMIKYIKCNNIKHIIYTMLMDAKDKEVQLNSILKSISDIHTHIRLMF